MLFRRTSKLVELETARKNAEKAKPTKKAAVSVCTHVLKCLIGTFELCLPCDQQVSVTFCWNKSKRITAGVIHVPTETWNIITLRHSPYSSDGGGEERSRGWVWTHYWNGETGGKTRAHVFTPRHPLQPECMFCVLPRLRGCRLPAWRCCSRLWSSGVRGSLLRPKTAPTTSTSTCKSSEGWPSDPSPHEASSVCLNIAWQNPGVSFNPWRHSQKLRCFHPHAEH